MREAAALAENYLEIQLMIIHINSVPKSFPAPPNYPLRDPKYHLIETIRPLIEVHWGV